MIISHVLLVNYGFEANKIHEKSKIKCQNEWHYVYCIMINIVSSYYVSMCCSFIIITCASIDVHLTWEFAFIVINTYKT